MQDEYELHAHYFKAETDCDGPHEDGWIIRLSEAEQARNASERTRMGDYDFEGRVLHQVVSLISPDGTLRVTRLSDGLSLLQWSEPTEEGHKYVEGRFCRDACPDERHHRDIFAEQMGY